MSLRFDYYGQNVGDITPDVTLTGDPALDNAALQTAGYKGGMIMALKTSATSGRGVVGYPMNGLLDYPYATLINGYGEYATSISPAGSKKMAGVRALPKFSVDAEAYVASPSTAYAIGLPLYAGSAGNVGLWTTDIPATGPKVVCGIVTHIPTVAEPWLGVAQLF